MRKIILVTNIPNPYRIPLFNELNRQLQEDGMDLTVIFASKGYSRRLSDVNMEECTFRYRILGSKPVSLSGNREHTTFSYKGLLKILRSEHPYRVIVSGFSIAAIKVWIASLLYGIKYIIWSGSIPSVGRNDSLLRNLMRKVLIKRSSACVAYGSLAKKYFISLGANPASTSIAINTVDTTFFRNETAVERQRISRDKYYITYMGYLVKRKQIHQVLQCITLLSSVRNDFMLDILGEGSCRKELEEFVRKNKLSDKVQFHGFIQKKQIPHFLARSSVFLFQTGFDIWGLTLTEAMAAGLPCIASPKGGATFDLVKEGETGFVIDYSETKKVADRINWLLNNRLEAERIGLNAERFIAEKANLSVSASGFVSALNASR